VGQVLIPLTISDLTGEAATDEDNIIKEIRGGQHGSFKLDLLPMNRNFVPRNEKTDVTLPFSMADKKPTGTAEIQVLCYSVMVLGSAVQCDMQ
jgi:hypothetical protein